MQFLLEEDVEKGVGQPHRKAAGAAQGGDGGEDAPGGGTVLSGRVALCVGGLLVAGLAAGDAQKWQYGHQRAGGSQEQRVAEGLGHVGGGAEEIGHDPGHKATGQAQQHVDHYL